MATGVTEHEGDLAPEAVATASSAVEPRRSSVPLAALNAARRGLFVVAGLLLFVVALDTIKAGAAGASPLLQRLDVSGPVNALGFGWLFAYLVLSGSPVAATSVSLLAGGTLTSHESFAAIAGSRLGASFIVLAVGFLLYLRGRRSPDGLAVGVIALLVTYTTQVPAFVLGLLSLTHGWLDGVRFDTPHSITSLSRLALGWMVDGLAARLPDVALLGVGILALLLSFAIFDRALPQLESEAEGIRRLFRMLERRPLMFVMGVLVTLTTMSVSLSVTVLVPLALKGYIRREHVIPYVMGANIATFIDTLVAAVLLGGSTAFIVVLNEMVWVAAVSLAFLLFAYRPYRAFVLHVARWVTTSPPHFATFLAVILGIPLVLLLA